MRENVFRNEEQRLREKGIEVASNRARNIA